MFSMSRLAVLLAVASVVGGCAKRAEAPRDPNAPITVREALAYGRANLDKFPATEFKSQGHVGEIRKISHGGRNIAHVQLKGRTVAGIFGVEVYDVQEEIPYIERATGCPINPAFDLSDAQIWDRQSVAIELAC